ncbi:uncharacterized protein LOC109946729 isoform X2 [Prunus persica]|uniref:uncharacterized protein LOC109946729 isoform X2 n=1 Tax=Prunus persica TaxID=3760 RepID=UPI0009AB8CC1|nr:uncharacterized protein LOC109946729 isoform X2 [Prunus persica]
MGELEANSTQMALVLESTGDNNRLQEVSGLIKDADEELNLKARIEEAEKLVAKTRQDKLELTEGIAQRVCDRSSTLLPRLENLNWHETELGYFLARERKKMNILQLFLLGFANKAHQGKPIKPCLPGEEIAKHKLNFRMGHGANSLAEEKQLLKQIIVSPKEINVSPKEGVVGSFSSLENEYYVLSKSKTGKEIDGLTELLLAVRQKIKQVDKELKVIEKDIESLQQKLQSMDQRKGEAHQCILKQRKQLLTKKKKTEKTTK